jgi:hypothetical protein
MKYARSRVCVCCCCRGGAACEKGANKRRSRRVRALSSCLPSRHGLVQRNHTQAHHESLQEGLDAAWQILPDQTSLVAACLVLRATSASAVLLQLLLLLLCRLLARRLPLARSWRHPGLGLQRLLKCQLLTPLFGKHTHVVRTTGAAWRGADRSGIAVCHRSCWIVDLWLSGAARIR